MAQTVRSESSKSSFVPRSIKPERNAHATSTSTSTSTSNERRCIYCGQMSPIVWVHGHGQCASCGINVEECCRGESCGFKQ